MKAAVLSRLRPDWRAPGWPGAAGALALLLGAAVAGGLQPHWQAESDRLARELALAQQARRAALTARLQAAPAGTAAAASQAQRVADLLELALRQGLQFSRTEQRADDDGGLRLHMPVQGGYAELRGFAEAALLADPALALLSLQLRRDAAGGAQLQAELVWWLDGGQR